MNALLKHAPRSLPTAATCLVINLLAAAALDAQQPADNADWSAVERALGRRGAMQTGDVMRFSFPRHDLRVMAGGVAVRPALALGSWVAFRRAGSEAVAMGDLVLTENEINPVIARLMEGDVRPTALHNHILNESPRIMYLHIAGHGEAAAIAQTIRSALEVTGTPLDTVPAAGTAGALELDTAGIAAILGQPGRMNGGVFQLNVARAERIVDHGHDVPPSMGLATVINFQPTGGGRAAITGDFVMMAHQVHRVMGALRAADIDITALHSHMLEEEPRLFFMHFWAHDDALRLARGLRSALDATGSVRPGR